MTPSEHNQPLRLVTQPNEEIDRSQRVTFTWNGKTYTGYQGDTIVSALYAAGERVFSRSMKYHSPRGVLTGTLHDPGTILQVDDEPNVRGAHRLIEEGMNVTSQNTWPSLKYDVRAVNQLGARFLGPGFYYKTFMKPDFLRPAYQRVLRGFVHGGKVSKNRPEETYEKRYAHTDVLVAGGGPAGMEAALAAAASGASVMLVEEDHQLGGHLRWADGQLARELRAQVTANPNITVYTNTTVAARYDDNWLAVVQRSPEPGMGERLIKTRARSLVVAAGLLERPYVFEGNDLPGVLLSTAARRLINLYSVRPGGRAVVVTANPEGDAAVEDLRRAGVEVVAVVDARQGDTVVRATGRGRVQSVELSTGQKIAADLLVTAVGWTAPTSLLNMSGDKPYYEPQAARFLPGGTEEGVYAAGGISGDGTVAQLRDHGAAVGARAAAHALAQRSLKIASAPTVSGQTEAPTTENLPEVQPLPVPQHPELFRSSTHGFVDYSEDITSSDLQAAVAEGYDSAELVKRFTTVTMGPLQGKIELVNFIAVVAEATGKTIAETGTTTWRPMYAPVTLGALAGQKYDPIRYSSIQTWHEAHGAKPMIAGQWIRPEHYGDPQAEVRRVRDGVGIIDVSPLGKIDLRGPDVPKLLNLLYTNKWSKLGIGKVRYGVMVSEDGVVMDDGVTARLDEDHYLMTTTTGGAGRVWDWIEEWLQTFHPEWQVNATPVSTAYTSINIAGPHARTLLSRLTDVDVSAEAFKYMEVRTGTVAGVENSILWRIGFTGELSYEIHVPAAYGLHVWETLLEVGQDLGVGPFGIEAQRILRLETGHLIVGQDTDGLTQGYSAGLEWAIKLDKDDFVGKPELAWQQQNQTGMRLVAVQPVDTHVVPDEASQILFGNGTIAGRITSARLSPTLGRSICLAQVEQSLAEPGTMVTIRQIDGTMIQGKVMEGLTAVDKEGTRLDNDSQPEARVEVGEPIGRSPVRVGDAKTLLAGWEVSAQPAAGPLTIQDQSVMTKLEVRSSFTGSTAEKLHASFGRTHRSQDGTLVIGSGPGQWYILGEPGSQQTMLNALQHMADSANELTTVVDLTHGRALFRITGDEAAALLNKLCSLELSDDIVPDGSALRSSVAGVVTDIIRDDVDGALSYLVHCERSSGQYLWDTLLDAGAEYRLAEVGYTMAYAN
ncbi:2Fe-2S iron-sulfur cluster-binding protein [Enteractinococcus coprophilus]|uniref:N-methylglutamate dehydrogenase subunit C n=1 Tax=Enteractinococcus coprophilus TaxID=1027633 RepID=A0A543AMJ7_9MICC|nr:2Fe-2S iron-sulfur cluster-binding protein [Enteractinococcus coprophilus]TQL73817.1 N-methylglutamate dehydrogenase subunit C [Enteractinococcus coprophilus]